jgi:hypothetical protein
MLLRAVFGMRFLWLAQQHPALRSAAQDASELLVDAHESARAQFVRVLSGEEISSTAIDSSRGDADLHAAGVCIVTIGAAAAAISLPFATPLKVYISTADVAIIDEAQMSGSPESVRVVRALPDACLLAWQGDGRQPMGGADTPEQAESLARLQRKTPGLRGLPPYPLTLPTTIARAVARLAERTDDLIAGVDVPPPPEELVVMGDIGRAPLRAPGDLGAPGAVSFAPRKEERADRDQANELDPLLAELPPQPEEHTPPAVTILALVAAAARLQVGLPRVATILQAEGLAPLKDVVLNIAFPMSHRLPDDVYLLMTAARYPELVRFGSSLSPCIGTTAPSTIEREKCTCNAHGLPVASVHALVLDRRSTLRDSPIWSV